MIREHSLLAPRVLCPCLGDTVMTSHVGIVLTLVALGIGPIALRPATSGWAAQDAVHDHDTGAPAATTPGQSQAPTQPSADQMAKMRADRMSQMAAADDQLKTLMAEVNAAKTTDAKVAAMTKLLNVLVEQRSMMRGQMEMQGRMMDQMMPMMHQMMHPPAK